MQTQIPTQQAQQNQSRAEHKSQESAQPQFEDSRPEATAQLRLQSLMANGVKSTQLKSMQAMMAANTPTKNLGQSPAATNPIPVQRMEEEEPLQAKTDEPVQREQAEVSGAENPGADAPPDSTPPPKPNNTGLPDNLKTGIENLSGISMDHVKVHYNSDKSAQLQAHAYAQGSEIHVAPGQEKHLPHEAWHVVQQAQGRVRTTVQMKGDVQVNDDLGLEAEADVMGRATIVQRALETSANIEASAKGGRFTWNAFRTRTKGPETKATDAEGLGVKINGYDKELRTKIEWKAIDSSSLLGTEVTATVLGPDHTLGGEPQSGANKEWNKAVKKLSKEANKAYIAGHLLNHNLGGPGNDQRNLTAIPAAANTKQSKDSEEEVKKLVNEEYRFVFYNVKVDYADATKGNETFRYANKITSTWCPVDHSGAKQGTMSKSVVDIESPFSDGSATLQKNTNKFEGEKSAQAEVGDDDMVLNNAGYLKIAVSVRSQLELRFTKIKNDLDQQANEERIGELEAELIEVKKVSDEIKNDLTERLATTESQLKATATELDASRGELEGLKANLQMELARNRELEKELNEINGRFDRFVTSIAERDESYGIDEPSDLSPVTKEIYRSARLTHKKFRAMEEVGGNESDHEVARKLVFDSGSSARDSSSSTGEEEKEEHFSLPGNLQSNVSVSSVETHSRQYENYKKIVSKDGEYIAVRGKNKLAFAAVGDLIYIYGQDEPVKIVSIEGATRATGGWGRIYINDLAAL